MDVSSLSDYPQRPGPSPGKTPIKLKLDQRDRLRAAIGRLACIAMVWFVILLLRSAALSSPLPDEETLVPLETQIVGDWNSVSGYDQSLNFSPDGMFKLSRIRGVVIRTGSYKIAGKQVVVSDVRSGNGMPVEGRFLRTLEEMAFDVSITNNGTQLEVSNGHDRWRSIENGNLSDEYHCQVEGAFRRIE
jgi:hypothetical protein